MEDHLEKKGIVVNKESLRTRTKSRRSIGDLEAKAEMANKKAQIRDSDDEDG